MDEISDKIGIPAEWEIFIRTLARKRKDVSSRLTKWYVLSFREVLKIDLYLLSNYWCRYIKHMVWLLSCLTPCTLWITALLLCSYLRLTCQVCHLMWENNTCIVSLLIRGATEWIGTTQPKHIQPLDRLRDHFLFLDWTWVKFFNLNWIWVRLESRLATWAKSEPNLIFL